MQNYINKSGDCYNYNIGTGMIFIPHTFIRSGFYSINIDGQTDRGLYWINSMTPSVTAYRFFVSHNNLDTYYAGNRGGGYSLRCLARQR